eukprot:8130590-Prorocentrum_lima.AAC.1
MQTQFDGMMAQLRLQTAAEIAEVRDLAEEAKQLAHQAAESASVAKESIRALKAEMDRMRA